MSNVSNLLLLLTNIHSKPVIRSEDVKSRCESLSRRLRHENSLQLMRAAPIDGVIVCLTRQRIRTKSHAEAPTRTYIQARLGTPRHVVQTILDNAEGIVAQLLHDIADSALKTSLPRPFTE
jgi:hypothetical protein